MAYIKNPTKEQLAEWEQAARRKEAEARAYIENLSHSYQTNPESIAEMLEFGTKMYQYSARNTMLIYAQNPHAMYVQSFKSWKDMGYSVKKGEKGLEVFVPVKCTYIAQKDGKLLPLSKATQEEKEQYRKGNLEGIERTNYKIGNVFDISQTTYPPELYPKLFSVGISSEKHADVAKGLENFSRKYLGYQVHDENLQSIILRGVCRHDKKEIALNHLLNDTQRLSTLAHECGHAMERVALGANKKIRSQREFEADSLGIMMESNFGFDITDARKQHLSDSFREMEQEFERMGKELDMNELFSDIFEIYRSNLPDIEKCVKEQLSINNEPKKQISYVARACQREAEKWMAHYDISSEMEI